MQQMNAIVEGCERRRLAPIIPAALAMTAKMGHLRLSLKHITYMFDEALFNAVNVLAMPPELVLEVVESSVSAMAIMLGWEMGNEEKTATKTKNSISRFSCLPPQFVLLMLLLLPSSLAYWNGNGQ
eukprot:scaffold10417_cov137-Skeletonema_marinoi.AAC.34